MLHPRGMQFGIFLRGKKSLEQGTGMPRASEDPEQGVAALRGRPGNAHRSYLGRSM